jgi:hypothetical protein
VATSLTTCKNQSRVCKSAQKTDSHFEPQDINLTLRKNIVTKRVLITLVLTAAMLAVVAAWIAPLLHPHPPIDSAEVPPSASQSDADSDYPGLPDARQQLIWDLEHATFEFENGIGKPFCKALQATDASHLQSFFSADFSGKVLPAEASRQVTKSGVVEITWKAESIEDSAPHSASINEFIEHLTMRLSSFETFRSVSLRVLKIDVESDDVQTARWFMEILLQATGADADGQFLDFKHSGRLTSSFSHDEVLTPGPVINTWTAESERLTRSQPLMSEVTVSAGLSRIALHDNWTAVDLPARQYTLRTASADFDHDNDPDIAIVTNTGQCYLLINQNGHFSESARALGLPAQLDSTASVWLANWIDVDNDGFEDLLLGAELFRNINGERFQRWPTDSGLQFRYYPMGAVVADYDADGLLDLYVLNQHRRAGETPPHGKVGWVGDDVTGAPNQLFRNVEGKRFEDVTATAGVESGSRHSFAATWLHANDDHYPDLYVANDFARNSFFINQGDGTFRDEGEDSGTADFATSMGVTSGDIDGDGHTEIYVANMFSKMGRRILGQVTESDYPAGVYEQLLGSCAGNRLYRQKTGSQSYEDVSVDLGINQVGWAYAPAFADFDADGFLDIYATAGFLSFQPSEPDG